MIKLVGLDYEIEYESGSSNLVVDALSRVKEQGLHHIKVSATMPEITKDIELDWSLLGG